MDPSWKAQRTQKKRRKKLFWAEGGEGEMTRKDGIKEAKRAAEETAGTAETIEAQRARPREDKSE